MLPDFPEAKKKLEKYFERILDSGSGIHSLIGIRKMVEGDENVMIDSSGVKSKPKRHEVSSTISLRDEEIEKMTFDNLVEVVTKCAYEINRQKLENIIKTIDEITQKCGTAIDCHGKELSPELLIECFESVEVEFNRDGKPKWPTLVAHPETCQKMKQIFDQIESDPNLRKRMDQLVKKKWNEWRDRENYRKLVG